MSDKEDAVRVLGDRWRADGRRGEASSGTLGLISLRLVPATGVYEVEPNGCLVSVFHQSVLFQLLDPQHPLYALLREEEAEVVWLGPPPAQMQVVFSRDRALLVDGGTGLPSRAYAFPELGGAEDEENATKARRLLDFGGQSAQGFPFPGQLGGGNLGQPAITP